MQSRNGMLPNITELEVDPDPLSVRWDSEQVWLSMPVLGRSEDDLGMRRWIAGNNIYVGKDETPFVSPLLYMFW